MSQDAPGERPWDKLRPLTEPLLEFRYGQRVLDPRDGLALFGPYDVGRPGRPENISYGLIGTNAGNNSFLEFIGSLGTPIISERSKSNPRLWPIFPGFEAAFLCALPAAPTRTFALDNEALIESSRKTDPNQRAYSVVDNYIKGLEDFKTKKDERIDLVVCIVPDEIWKNCRPTSQPANPVGQEVTLIQRRLRASRQNELFDKINFEPYQYAVDFRRQLKARAMEMDYDIGIQIIRESTLRLTDAAEFGERRLTPLSDRAWNLGLAFYYKAGGKPWRLSTAREGVCYVGLVYKRSHAIHGGQTACCAAQMFLDTGDGQVLRSDFGPWYSPRTKELHLDANQSRKLMGKVLATYESTGGRPLTEVFLHYRSSIDSTEYHAFKSVCPPNVKLVAIRVKEDRFGIHLYREGTRPVLRGSFWKINDRMCYLWASGFKPRLGTYDGMETPVPLRIEIQYGEADIAQVAVDILGLTKLNFNECKFGDSAPVTIGFSDHVGEILVSNPNVKNPSTRFKNYI